MEAGEEMDLLIHRMFFYSCEFEGTKDREWRDGTLSYFCVKCGNPGGYHFPNDRFSSDIAAVWLVIKKLDFKTVDMWWNDSGSFWLVSLDPQRRVNESCRFRASGDCDLIEDPTETLPLAICRAALLSKL